MTPESPDHELVTAAKRGSQDAFDLLVHRHSARMMRLALGMVSRSEEAEDLVQEAFSRVLCRLTRFRNGSQFSTWLYKITLNLCRDALRRKKIESAARQDLDREQSGRFKAERPTADSVEAIEEMRRLRQGLERLSEKPRAALLLRVDQGLSHKEIARVLGTTQATSRVLVAEARKALWERWSKRSSGRGSDS